MIENPRVRLALAEHGRRIALMLAILGAVFLVLAIWTVATPASETVRQPADTQTIETEISHSAEVTSRTSPWDSGTVLENHPAYLLNASPTLDLTVQTSAPPGSTVVHDARLELQVVRDGAVVWEETRPLASEDLTATDGTATSTASIDVEDLQTQRRELQDEFAGVGTVRSRIVTDARYETDAYEGSLTAGAPLEVTNRAFWIDGDASASDARSRTAQVTRTAPVDWGTVLLFVVLGIAAVGAAAAAATYRVEADIDWLRQELHRQRYDDWISDGDLPMGVGTEYVSLDSLKDVVDVAIDTNQRVVYDDRRNVFAVISGDVVYYYSKDGDWNRVAWPQAEREESGPSFLEAFGMGDESGIPEVEATPSGEPGFGADGGPVDAASDPEAGDQEDDTGSPGGTGDDGPETAFGDDDATADPPTDDGDDGSLGPAERPPEDRPFGGGDEDE